jgi:hypothetical protein
VNAIGSRLRAFGAFWWDFIVGDDWRLAAGVVAAIAVTGALARSHRTVWWFLPLAVLMLLALSLLSSVRASRRP